ncbi:MAG TPA: hypothetical protein EYP30_01755 [Archaeoglobaceae archaeon]|nr:hypothetical protein [Archaeoglobaceae archaeon]
MQTKNYEIVSRECLLANPLGCYPSSTIIELNTRKYHIEMLCIQMVTDILSVLNCILQHLFTKQTMQLLKRHFSSQTHPEL